MAITFHEWASYVDADGSYGTGQLIIFDAGDLTDYQWEVMCDLHDADRIEYVRAIMNGDAVAHYEEGVVYPTPENGLIYND